MFKKSDYTIISIICFFLGILIIYQFSATKKYEKLTQPENNEIMAVEVGKLTKVNSDLRREVQDLTQNLNKYTVSSQSNKSRLDLFNSDLERMTTINGEKPIVGQGVVISINGKLNVPQVVDLINAIKNIGADVISINDKRLVINTSLNEFNGLDHYIIKVRGNSKLLKSAMERKGGIVEQISNKDIVFAISESGSLDIPLGAPITFKYSRIID